MKNRRRHFLATALMSSTMLTFFGSMPASAEADDPSSRIARLAYVEGSVSLQPGGTNDWVAPPINRPLTTGDQLWSDHAARAELQLDGSSVRLAADTSLSLLNLSDNVTQIQLSAGTLLLRVRRLDDNETYEIDTPNLAFTVLRPGLYRIAVDAAGNSTAILVRQGQGEVSGGGTAFPIREGEYESFMGNDQLSENPVAYDPGPDAFDQWSAARDTRWDRSISARYVSDDVVGYEDLDDHGTWTTDPQYGNVWMPRGVDSNWAPYHSGHWAYIAPWGYTWVDDSAWGFAPFHYGRWVAIGGRWAWIPAPPRRPHAVYIRPVYAPALVAWVGVGAGVCWFALGPREVYVPSYHVSPRYVRNVNISNTNVNTTVINNVYNTTIVNRTVVNNTYVNRNVPGAIASTSTRAFTSAQSVERNIVRVDSRALSSARVGTFAPAAAPTRQAVLGSGHQTERRPPAPLQARPVVARIAPPTASPQVRIAPPARFASPPAATRSMAAAPSVNAAPSAPVGPSAAVGRPQARIGTMAVPAAPSAIHPSQIPVRQAPSPAVADSVLQRQQFQEQQRQVAQQNAVRARLQQSQELEHQRAAREAADKARQQEVERQHQVQTQQLAQRQAQQLQQLQARQQEQRRQQDAQPVPKIRRPDNSSQQRP